MLLKFYDRNKNFKGVLENARELSIEETLEISDKILSFQCQYEDIRLIAENEGYIETSDDIFVIKEISRDSTDATATVHGQLDIEDLEGKAYKKFETVEQTIVSALNTAFLDTGWSIIRSSSKKKRTLRMENVSALDILKQALKTYRCEIKIDSFKKQIEIYEKIGSDKGVYFISALNLKKVELQASTYDFYTEIIGYGKDGLQTELLTNYSYSKKKKRYLWKDERYTVLESLTEDAQAKLDDMAKPYLSYTGDLLDLANMSNEYSLLSFELGDIVWLIDDETDIKEQQRIVGIVRYPDEPERNSFTLANKVLSFDELTSKYDLAAQTVDNITSDNGTVSGSSIDSITSEQVSDLNDGISKSVAYLDVSGRITAAEAEIGTLSANTADFHTLTAERLSSVEGDITNLRVIDLSAVNASIGTLETNYGNITNLLAGNADVGNLANIHLTTSNAVIDSALIKNAVMQTVTVADLLAGEIDTSKFRIISGDGGMAITGATQQFYDKDGNVRLQLGKDANGDFTFVLYDSNGQGVMLDAASGLHASAISDGLIVNKMVADNANISASKLDIASLFKRINDSQETINMSRIWYDEGNQSLTQLYSELSTSVRNVGSQISSFTDTASAAKAAADAAVAASENVMTKLSGISTLDAMSVILTNDAHVIHTSFDGSGGVYTFATTTVHVFLGDVDISALCAIDVFPSTGISGKWDAGNRTYQVKSMSDDNGYIDFIVKYAPGVSSLTSPDDKALLTPDGKALTVPSDTTSLAKRFSLSKSPDGRAGYSYRIITEPDIIRRQADGTLNPSGVNIRAICCNGASVISFLGKFVIEQSKDGDSYEVVYTSTLAEADKTFDISSDTKLLRITLKDPVTNLLLDTKSVIVIADADELAADLEGAKKAIQTTTERVTKIETSMDGFLVDLSDITTELHGVSDGVILHQITRTDTENGSKSTFTQKLFKKGKDVTKEYPKGQFRWFMRDEKHLHEYYLGSGYSVTVDLNSTGYGAHVIGEFTTVESGTLLTPDDLYISMPDDKRLVIDTDTNNVSA